MVSASFEHCVSIIVNSNAFEYSSCSLTVSAYSPIPGLISCLIAEHIWQVAAHGQFLSDVKYPERAGLSSCSQTCRSSLRCKKPRSQRAMSCGIHLMRSGACRIVLDSLRSQASDIVQDFVPNFTKSYGAPTYTDRRERYSSV